MNATDPSGDATLGICVQASAALGIGFHHRGTGAIGLVCLVRTVFTPKGNDDIGFTETVGQANGHAVGVSIGVSAGYQVSNADTLQELGKHFLNTNISAGALTVPIGVSGSYFTGTAADGRNIWGIDGGISFGEGESVAKFSTHTNVQQVNNSIEANALRLLWDSLLPTGMFNQEAIEGLLHAAESASKSASSSSAEPSPAPCT